MVTEIVPVEIDVLKHWPKVVEIAKQSTLIFNMIDIGECFDIAVQSLALSLNIPLCLGGTFQSTATVDFLNPEGHPCLKCINDTKIDEEVLSKLLPSCIQTVEDISFIPSNIIIVVSKLYSNLIISYRRLKSNWTKYLSCSFSMFHFGKLSPIIYPIITTNMVRKDGSMFHELHYERI